MTILKPGMRVAFKDIKAHGFIIEISGDTAIVQLDQGLETSVPVRQLISIQISPDELKSHLSHQEFRRKKALELSESPKKKKSKTSIPTIDLHYEVMVGKPVDDHLPFILQKQIAHLEYRLSKLKAARAREVIVIHGVGRGVLREEVYTLVQRMGGMNIKPANPELYGQGAAHIIFINE